MNSKSKSNKRNISSKAIIFWTVMAAFVIALIVLFVIRAVQKKDITSYTKVDALQGQEVFTQTDSSYYVLVYDYASDEAMKDFDNTVFQYLTYYRDNKTKGIKMYKFDITDRINKMCVGDTCNLVGATSFPTPNQKYEQDADKVLGVVLDECPVLLLVSGGEVISAYEGTSSILTQLNSDMSK